MHSLAKATFIIYLIVALCIFVELFYCIDVNNETVTVDIKETTTHTDGISITEIITINQTTMGTGENITEAPEHKSAMEICNETFPTPKGSVL